MGRYTILLYPEEGGYSVLVPLLPGCATQGDTVEEALANAREAIEGHVASLLELGRYVPEEEEPAIMASVDVPTQPETPAGAARGTGKARSGGHRRATTGA